MKLRERNQICTSNVSRYDTLKDDESRTEYDYMLDHPEEMWANYYRYYRRRMTPKVDVRLVIAVTISVISAIQYYSAVSNYDEAIKYLATVPKYRIQAAEIAKEDGLLKRDKKAERGKSKEQIKEEEERILRKVSRVPLKCVVTCTLYVLIVEPMILCSIIF